MNLPNFGNPRLAYPLVRKAPGASGVVQTVALDGVEVYAEPVRDSSEAREWVVDYALYSRLSYKLRNEAGESQLAAFEAAEAEAAAAALAAAQGES